MKKIAFTGTSGSGKTTLVSFLCETEHLPHQNGSSGELLTIQDARYLKDNFGFVGGKGHAHVIMESHKNPNFGLEHQRRVLQRRTELISAPTSFVTDRSPLDNFVYFLLQTGLYHPEEVSKEFMDKCIDAFSKLTHVIYVPAMLVEIENNKSRVANYYYQRAVDQIFNSYWQVFTHHAKVINPSLRLLKLVDLNLETRKSVVSQFVK